MTAFLMPSLGADMDDGKLVEWLKKPGDVVALDEPIVSLETDKVAIEVASPVAGILTDQLVKEGDTVNVDAVIALIGDSVSAAGNVPDAPRTETAKSVDEQKLTQDTAPAASADLGVRSERCPGRGRLPLRQAR